MEVTGKLISISLIVACYCPSRLARKYISLCCTLSLSLSTVRIYLSLSHSIAFLVYRAYVCLVVCYYTTSLMTKDEKSNSARKGHSFDLLKENSTYYIHVFLRQNTHREKAENLILRRHMKKFANYAS